MRRIHLSDFMLMFMSLFFGYSESRGILSGYLWASTWLKLTFKGYAFPELKEW